VVKNYKGALQHVEWTCGGVKSAYKSMIRAVALAKGLPERSGDKEIDAFFS
jgi:hypothetical protein